MSYDPNKYTEIGVGNTLQHGDFYVSNSGVVPIPEHQQGYIVSDNEDFTFLRPLLVGDNCVVAIAQQYGIETEIGMKALKIALANIQVLDRKQRDYGSGNIAAFGEFGVLVRTWDKVSRLRNLLTNVKTPANESIEDSWLDLCNYSIIAVLCRRGEWR